ncbi:MAG: VanW family protein [Vampirovibrionales bacterium]|nr:VanW family protein [Vampirovibrionales bacterium]
MKRAVLLLSLPLALIALWFFTRPFPDELIRQQVSLSPLSSVQKQNIELAAERLNGSVIAPEASFSFNKTVGPRTATRGYLAATSYIADDSPKTLGGGICLLSSTLYQLALGSGLKIITRTPHLRPVNTVPPGLDAAIWYGRLDVSFQNNSGQPLQLLAKIRNNTLTLAFRGSQPLAPVSLQKQVQSTPQGLYVSLSRKVGTGPPEKISSDYYHE